MCSRSQKEPTTASFPHVSAFLDRTIGDYGAGPDCSGIEVPKLDGISKEDLDTAVGAGARIGDAVIVERASGDYVPAIRFEGKDTWRVLRLRRYDASRAWRNLDAVHAFLRACNYAGDWILLREDSVRLAELPGISDL